MASTKPTPHRRQFRLATLLFIMFLVSVIAALLGGLLRVASRTESTPAWVYVLLTVAAPVGIIIILAAANGLLRAFQNPNPHDSTGPIPEDEYPIGEYPTDDFPHGGDENSGDYEV